MWTSEHRKLDESKSINKNYAGSIIEKTANTTLIAHLFPYFVRLFLQFLSLAEMKTDTNVKMFLKNQE